MPDFVYAIDQQARDEAFNAARLAAEAKALVMAHEAVCVQREKTHDERWVQSKDAMEKVDASVNELLEKFQELSTKVIVGGVRIDATWRTICIIVAAVGGVIGALAGIKAAFFP